MDGSEGITSFLGYIGRAGSVFPAHNEDSDIYFMFCLLEGAAKTFYMVPNSVEQKFWSLCDQEIIKSGTQVSVNNVK